MACEYLIGAVKHDRIPTRRYVLTLTPFAPSSCSHVWVMVVAVVGCGLLSVLVLGGGHVHQGGHQDTHRRLPHSYRAAEGCALRLINEANNSRGSRQRTSHSGPGPGTVVQVLLTRRWG